MGRFRILGGGAKLEYNGEGGRSGANEVGNDVASTSFGRHVPIRFLINQCQIITFLILKSDIIENSRIELRGIVLPVYLQIKLKLHLLLFYPAIGYICDFFLFHLEIEGKGGFKGYVAPLLKLLGGGGGGGGSPLLPLFLRLWFLLPLAIVCS